MLAIGLLASQRSYCLNHKMQQQWELHLLWNSSYFLNCKSLQGPPTPEKFENAIRARSGKYEQPSMLKVSLFLLDQLFRESKWDNLCLIEPFSNLQRTGSKSNSRAISDEDKAQLPFNWSGRRTDESSWEKSDKILEVDTEKPHINLKRRNLFHSSHLALASDQYTHSFTTSKDSTTHQTVPSPSSGEIQSSSPLKFPHEDEEVYSASSKGGCGRRSPFTPSKSDASASFLSGYSDYCYPNYMCYTESSRAKLRSLSAPKQRPQYERSSSTKRYSIHGFGEQRSNSAQRASALRASFTSKAYPGSGHLDRLGMPIEQRF